VERERKKNRRNSRWRGFVTRDKTSRKYCRLSMGRGGAGKKEK